MHDLAFQYISDGCETDVWMRAHIEPPARRELARPKVIEEHERPQVFA